jgi:hypothetical protein
MPRAAILAAGGLLLAASPTLPRTWYINPDGTGDVPTIHDGLLAAAPGDTLELACGTYSESYLGVGLDLTVRSATGFPDCVTIDAQSSLVLFTAGSTATDQPPEILFEGLTLQGTDTFYDCHYLIPSGACTIGRASIEFLRCVFVGNRGCHGAAINSWGSYWYENQVTVRDCEFHDNRSWVQGGAIFAGGGSLAIDNSLFSYNGASYGYGTDATLLARDTDVTVRGTRFERAQDTALRILDSDRGSSGVEGCEFVENTGPLFQSVGPYPASFRGCLVRDNSSLQPAFAHQDNSGSTELEILGCTIVNNAFSGGLIRSTGPARVARTIVADNEVGDLFLCEAQGSFDITCSDFFSNSRSIWDAPCSPALTAVVDVDPLFCDPEHSDYHLQWGSPCLPANSGGCDLIGCYGFGGCSSVSVDDTSWGKIKAMYR